MSTLKPSPLKFFWAILCLAALLLAGCRGAASTPAQTQPPQAIFTAAAQTAQARMTEMAAVTPTQPATPTFTLEPTQAVTLTATLTSTIPLTGTVTATGTLQASGTDKLEFVRDVTVPDGTQFKPGEAFVKTWQLKNTGTSTWNSQYSLVYSSGEQMGAPASIPLSSETPPGGTADVSANLTAPGTAGSYFGFWMLRGPSGKPFGIGPNGDQPFYVQIIVGGSGGSTTPGPSGDTVSDVTLVVDNAAAEGCPHTFFFVGAFRARPGRHGDLRAGSRDRLRADPPAAGNPIFGRRCAHGELYAGLHRLDGRHGAVPRHQPG